MDGFRPKLNSHVGVLLFAAEAQQDFRCQTFELFDTKQNMIKRPLERRSRLQPSFFTRLYCAFFHLENANKKENGNSIADDIFSRKVTSAWTECTLWLIGPNNDSTNNFRNDTHAYLPLLSPCPRLRCY